MLDNLIEAANEYGHRVIARARKNTKVYGNLGQKSNRRIEADGKLAKGLFYTITSGTLGMVVNYFSKEEYGTFIESGTKPSTKKPSPKMVESFISWMKAKPVKLRKKRPNALSASSTAFAPKSPNAIKSAAYAMAQSRLRKGSKPRPFMLDAVETETTTELMQPLANALALDAEIAIVNNINRKSNNLVSAILT